MTETEQQKEGGGERERKEDRGREGENLCRTLI
jgi:hypothetical protein